MIQKIMFKLINKAYKTDNLIGEGFDSQTLKHNHKKSASLVFSFLLLFQIIVGVFLFAPDQTYAAASTWTGVTSTDWGAATNWSLGTVPDSTTDVTIPDTTAINAPSISSGAACKGLTIAANGVLNGNGNTINVYGNWTNSGTFNHGNGKIVFIGSASSGPYTFTPGPSSYYDVEENKSYGFGNYDDLSISGTAIVLHNFTQTDGDLLNGQIDVSVDYVIGANSHGSPEGNTPTVVNLNGTSDQSIVYNSGGVGARIKVDKASGTLTVADNIIVNSWTYVKGTVVGVDTHTLIFGDIGLGYFTPGSLVYGNVEINKSNHSGNYDDVSISGIATVSGNLIQTSGELVSVAYGSGQINLAGNYVIGAASGGISPLDHCTPTVINFNHASNNQSITSSGGIGAQIRVDKTGGTLAVSSDIVVDGWDHIQGMVTGLDTYTLTLGDDFLGSFIPGSIAYGNIVVNKTNHYVSWDGLTVGSGALNVSGNLTISDGKFILNTNNPNISLAGNLSISSASTAVFTKGTGTITFNGTAPSIFTDSSATKQNIGTVVLNKTNTDESQNKLTLVSGMTCNTLTVDGTVGQRDIFDLGANGYILTLANAGAVSTVFTLNGTLVPGTSTVKYTATNSGGNINIASAPYNSLQLSGAETYALTAATTLTGDLAIDTTSIFNTSTYNLNVAGNFTNQGTFTPNTNTVILNGTNQTLTGNTSFYNLTKIIASSATLTFAASSTTTINSAGTLTLQGTNGNSYLSLRSATPITPWNLNVNAAANTGFNFLDIQDSNAAGGKALTALNSINSNNNTNWTITPPSTSNLITSFNLDTPATTGTINDTNHTVSLIVPSDTVVTSLTPTITVSAGATISPATGIPQDFTNSVTYTVTAQDGITTQVYTVSVNTIPNIQFTAATSSASEAVTTANIGLILSKTWTSDVTVNYAVTGGTATNSGTDYTLANGTATITAGSTTTNIPITITEDSLYEQNETIQITISSPTNATLGTDTVHTFNIQENDSAPSVTLSKSAATLSENNGTATIIATLSNPSYQDVIINLTFSGTATNITNYTRSADSITIPAGSTTNSITLTGVNNSTYETPDKTIITDIDTVTNGTKDAGSPIQTVTVNEATAPSAADQITSFNFDTPVTIGTINDTAHTVSLTVPFGTIVTSLTPTITISSGATISPTTGTPQDFTNPVTYTVTAQDDATIQAYTVTVNFTAAPSSGSSSFIPPKKPIIPFINGQIDLPNLPQDITRIAISRTPDFKGVSWEEFSIGEFNYINETQEKLYLKFSTKEGGVSDVVIYIPTNIGDNISGSGSDITTSNLKDGDIVKIVNNPDVYIIKIKNNKQYKRLILSPSVFQSYGHLKWSNLKIISEEEINQYTTSSLVKETTDTVIYELFPNGDIGERRLFDTSKSYDTDSVYEINKVDRDSYREILALA